MMKFLVIATLSILLTGCSSTMTPNLIRTEYRNVSIPQELLNACPDLPRLPKTSTLTDSQVASLITRLYRNNSVCKQAIDKIKEHDEMVRKSISDNRNK